MFPNVLSDHLFSLKAKQDRLSLSLFIYLNNDYELEKYEIKKTIINVNKNMTYEQANKKILKQKGNIYELFKISKSLFIIYKGKQIYYYC